MMPIIITLTTAYNNTKISVNAAHIQSFLAAESFIDNRSSVTKIYFEGTDDDALEVKETPEEIKKAISKEMSTIMELQAKCLGCTPS